jgi:hypothetical protein
MKIAPSILVCLLAGCGAADTAETEHAPLPPMEQPGQPTAQKQAQPVVDRNCPLALPDAQMVSEVTADGVALVFRTTGGGDPAELRARVHQMAERHNEAQVPAEDLAAKSETAGDGMASAEGAHGMDMHGAAREVPSRAAVEDIAGGARVVFTPADPAKVGLLREQIRLHGKEMASTNCSASAPTGEAAPPPSRGERKPRLEPTPTPSPGEPISPDRPKTPDQPVTPPAAPPPPSGEPFVQ